MSKGLSGPVARGAAWCAGIATTVAAPVVIMHQVDQAAKAPVRAEAAALFSQRDALCMPGDPAGVKRRVLVILQTSGAGEGPPQMRVGKTGTAPTPSEVVLCPEGRTLSIMPNNVGGRSLDTFDLRGNAPRVTSVDF